MPKILQQRSSWPSSSITGLIGWNSFVIIIPLIGGYAGAPGVFLCTASVLAILHFLLHRGFWSTLDLLCGLTILVGAALMRTVVKLPG